MAAARLPTMATTDHVYILIHPDGRAEWGGRLADAERQLGPHGVGKAFLDDYRRLRIATSDCALILPDEYAPNPYARAVLADLVGVNANRAPEVRGPVAVFGFDSLNEWDSTRPFTGDERNTITLALELAGCTVA